MTSIIFNEKEIQLLSEITSLLKKDMNFPLIGEGYDQNERNKHFGKIKLKIYQKEEQSSNSYCIWNTVNQHIPFYYRKDVEEVITIFLNHLLIVRNDDIKLIFEIIDGEFDKDLSRASFYRTATIKAIVNAYKN